MRSIVPVLAASLWLAACSSTYHPEYHPITVSNFSQNVSYPVSVQNGGPPQARSPVFVAPMPAQTVVVPGYPAGSSPPPEWPLGY